MVAGGRKSRLYVLLALSLCGLAVAQAQDQPSPQPQPDVPQHVRASAGVTAGLLIKKVAPRYPKQARKKHIEGIVVMAAKISKNGDIVDLSVISGDPLLAQSATDAVKQWKYRPYL